MSTPFSTRKNIGQAPRQVGETEDEIDDFDMHDDRATL